MATKIVKVTKEEEHITCDADGCDREGTHIPFNISGKTFDLCDSHKAQIARGTATRQRAAGAGRKPQTDAEKADNAAAKAWAISKGKVDASQKGQVKAEVVEAWRKASSPV